MGDGTAGWRGQLGAVCKDVDNQLGQALHGSMLLLGQQTQVGQISPPQIGPINGEHAKTALQDRCHLLVDY